MPVTLLLFFHVQVVQVWNAHIQSAREKKLRRISKSRTHARNYSENVVKSQNLGAQTLLKSAMHTVETTPTVPKVIDDRFPKMNQAALWILKLAIRIYIDFATT